MRAGKPRARAGRGRTEGPAEEIEQIELERDQAGQRSVPCGIRLPPNATRQPRQPRRSRVSCVPVPTSPKPVLRLSRGSVSALISERDRLLAKRDELRDALPNQRD